MNLFQLAEAARLYREKLLRDPYRPQYHFCIPDGDGIPGDPNGYFFADGRHHLMYLYRHYSGAFHWGHVSSADLLHWRHHPDCLVKGEKDDGCFSGGAFVDDDGTAYITYWIYNREIGPDTAQGIGLARACPPYDHWEQLPRPIVSSTRWGILDTPDGQHVGCADPSNIWKKDGVYYMQTGNKPVLDAHGRDKDAPVLYRGDWTELFSSRDLENWEYRGRFYHRFPGGPDDSEDDMCASFLPLPSSSVGGALTDRYLQLFISHNRGCQYYIGRWEGDWFTPEKHGRMSWIDDTYFAPEAALDGKGRQIAFAWLRDDLPGALQEFGWCGVFGLPRSFWLREDGELGIAPAAELTQLRLDETVHASDMPLCGSHTFPIPSPDACEIRITARDLQAPLRIHLMQRVSGERVTVFYDPAVEILGVDGRGSGSLCRAVCEEAPLSLAEGEPLTLTVYIDRSVIEVFACDRQAITRRIYYPSPILPRTEIEGTGTLTDCRSWALMPAMPY